MIRGLSIRSKLVLGSILIAVVPMVLIGSILIRNIKTEMLESTKGNIEIIVQSVTRDINTFLTHDLEGVRFISGLPQTVLLAERIVKGDEGAKIALRDIFAKAVTTMDEYRAFFLLHPETGEVLCSNLPDHEGRFFDRRPYFVQGRKGPFIYRIHYSLDIEKNILAMASPVMSDSGLKGVIAAWINLDELTEIMKKTAPISNYMVSRANMYIFDVPGGDDAAMFRSGISDSAVERALDGGTGSDIFRNYRSVDVVGAYTYVPDLDVALIAENPLDEVLATANAQGRKYFISMTAAAIFVMLMAIYYGNRLTRPIAYLTSSIRSYREGERETINVPEGNPEVTELTTAFNSMFRQRRDAENLLREGEARLAESQHIAHIGSWQYIVAEKSLWWSDECYSIYGVERDSRLSLELFIDRVHPEDRELLLEQIHSQKPYRTDYRITLPDGKVKHIHEEVKMFHTEEGKLSVVRGTAQDITAVKEAEHELKKSRERYQHLFQSAPVSIWEEDLSAVLKRLDEIRRTGVSDFRHYFSSHPEVLAAIAGELIVLNVNDASVRMYGAETREQLIASMDKVIVPESYEALSGVIAAIAEGRDQFECETVNGTLDGRRLNVLISIRIPSELSTYRSVVVTVVDITGRKRIESALRESEGRYRLLFEKAPLGIFHFTREGGITDCNEKFAEIIGAGRPEVIRLNLNELRDPIMKKAFETSLSGATGSYEGNYLSIVGNKLTPLKAIFSPLFSDDGSVAGGIGVFEDISERKKLEEQLLHSQKMEAVGQLAGGVAHDFNNILTAMISYAYLLQKHLKEDPRAEEIIGRLMQLTDRAKNITQGLLTFSRKQYFEFRPMKLNSIVREAEKLLKDLIREDIEIVTDISGNDPTVVADRHQMEQVIMNLATNAQDAMPDGGRLVISTRIVEMDRSFIIDHGFGDPGMYAVLSVSDTGTGMSSEIQEKIFEPFFTTKEVGKGTGLGLAIVYGIVKQHSGHIVTHSVSGKGTAFDIYLPEIKASPLSVRKTEMQLPAGEQATILLAEDDQMVRESLKGILENYGYNVIEAKDGISAIDEFVKHRDEVALILLDIVMPRKNGREVYEVIRGMVPDIKALFISGYTADIIQKKNLPYEGFDLIEKPLNPVQLLEKIRSVLGG